ncbi:MAG: hypothetical protein GFH27_549347n98 [Chloroflexi bacterium AL-W]|nr:hypothetical protein [Chloroflexi bacterium AL-N5]NOK85421.1 hypothetical protein [Chloroflexi bacterium AL-W]
MTYKRGPTISLFFIAFLGCVWLANMFPPYTLFILLFGLLLLFIAFIIAVQEKVTMSQSLSFWKIMGVSLAIIVASAIISALAALIL